MNKDFMEKDWKLFRKKLPDWQEAYMTRLCEEYAEILRSGKKGSERFWELEKRIREDRSKTGVIARMSHQKMIQNLTNLVLEGAIALEDLDGFSEETKKAVKAFSAPEDEEDTP